MKGFLKKSAACLMAAVCGVSCLALAACGEQTANYNVITTDETYAPAHPPLSGASMDEDITIDGNFDESFYDNLQWLTLHKIDGAQTATVVMTVRIAKEGLLIAADVTENTLITYNELRAAASDSCIEFYIGFGDGTTWRDGLFEVDMTAGGRFNIRRFNNGYSNNLLYDFEDAPYYEVVRNGSLKDGECTAYRFELFMPYGIFGRTNRCETVYVNPTHIAMPTWDWTVEAGSYRNWYNIGEHQSSLFGWDKLNQGFTFDRNGAVINDLVIEESEGGTVTEEWGYDYCITGDEVNLNVTPDEGYELASFLVNGEECVQDVVAGVYTFTAQGDTTVVAEFISETQSGIYVESSVEAWVDYPPSEFVVRLNNGESDFTLEYDDTKLEIDKEAGTVRALAEGRFEVKVTSGEDTASFFVNASSVDTSCFDRDHFGTATQRESTYNTSGTNAKTTVFIGDSFFDVASWSWYDFYTDYEGKDALALGISSSTSYDWENFYLNDMFEGMAPKNLVVNIGTNNFYDDHRTMQDTVRDLERLFTCLHAAMPDTQIYYFSIAQRADTTYSAVVSAVNDTMQAWCANRDWITIIDIEDKVTAADLADGVHPNAATYRNVYMKELEAAGCVIENK